LSIPALQNAFGLTDMQMDFVQALAKGFSPAESAERAGYANCVQVGTKLMGLPSVQAAVFEAVQQSLRADASVNLVVLRKIRDDDKAPARVRADIGLQLMKLAGHVAPTTRDDKPQKALSDMTQAELLEHIDRNQAAIEKAEAELMAKAKDVTPGDSVSRSVPKTHDDHAKPLNYLD
jgi:phage terminase small subunit